MEEFRVDKNYDTGCMVGLSILFREDPNPFIGQITMERCPQCGARLFRNKVNNEWCWNCNYGRLEE